MPRRKLSAYNVFIREYMVMNPHISMRVFAQLWEKTSNQEKAAYKAMAEYENSLR